MNLLWVEDDMIPIVHHKEAIQAKGWNISRMKTLNDAFCELQSGTQIWDIVVIDLNVPLGASLLPQALIDLNVLDAQSDVLGRLLGLWLWEKAGRRCSKSGPMHAYFTTVPDRYEVYASRPNPEFASPDGTIHKEYVLNKWTTKSLSDELERIRRVWDSDFSTSPQIKNA